MADPDGLSWIKLLQHMKLPSKFALIFSAIILLMGGVSYYGIYKFQYDILQQEITEKLETEAKLKLDKLDTEFYNRLDDLDVLSTNPVFFTQHPLPQQITRELAKFQHRYPDYRAVSYYDMARRRIASTSQLHPPSWQHPPIEYWPAIYAGRDHIVDVSKSATQHIPTLHFAERVIDTKGKTLGILVAAAPASAVYSLMGEKSEIDPDVPKYKIDIFDQNGLVLFSNYNQDAILNAVDDDFGLIEDALPAVRSVGSLTQVHEVAHNLEKKVLLVFAKEQGFRNFRGNGWTLKIMHVQKDAFAPVAALGRQVFMLLLAVSLFGIVAILAVLSYTVVSPIQNLNSVATRLGYGELDARVTIESTDEIGDLGKTFNAMASSLRDARERLSQAANSALARANLAERQIIMISEDTQQQIGRELHDDLGQQLTGVAFMGEMLYRHLKSQNHPDAGNASRITALINEAISKTNKLSQGLYPVELKESGLRAMLMGLASNTESIYAIECEFICEGEPAIDTDLTSINLFRIVQEAVHNAVKHSSATRITIRMVSDTDTTTIEVIDNGCGIGSPADVELKGGLGMHTMHYRATLLGASLSIAGLAGGGTRVAISLSAHAHPA